MSTISNTQKKHIILCKELCQWIKKNGEVPATSSVKHRVKSERELKLARFLIQQRRAKQGLYGTPKWLPIYDKIAEDFGYPELFEKKRKFGPKENRCREMFEFRVKYGRYPLIRSDDEAESNLATWRAQMIRARTQKFEQPDKLLSTSLFYDEYLLIAEEYGFPYAFHKSCSIYEKYTSLIQWFIEHKKHPIYSNNQKMMSIAKEFYKSYLDENKKHIVESVLSDFHIDKRDTCVLLMGVPEIRYHEFNSMINELSNFIHINNRLPNRKIPQEEELHDTYEIWFKRISVAMKGIPTEVSRERMRQLGFVKGYKECMEQFLESMVDTMNLHNFMCFISISNNKAKFQIKKAIEYTFFVNNKSFYSPKESKKLLRWENSMMTSIEGKGTGPEWIPEVDEVLTRLGFTGFKID